MNSRGRVVGKLARVDVLLQFRLDEVDLLDGAVHSEQALDRLVLADEVAAFVHDGGDIEGDAVELHRAVGDLEFGVYVLGHLWREVRGGGGELWRGEKPRVWSGLVCGRACSLAHLLCGGIVAAAAAVVVVVVAGGIHVGVTAGLAAAPVGGAAVIVVAERVGERPPVACEGPSLRLVERRVWMLRERRQGTTPVFLLLDGVLRGFSDFHVV